MVQVVACGSAPADSDGTSISTTGHLSARQRAAAILIRGYGRLAFERQQHHSILPQPVLTGAPSVAVRPLLPQLVLLLLVLPQRYKTARLASHTSPGQPSTLICLIPTLPHSSSQTFTHSPFLSLTALSHALRHQHAMRKLTQAILCRHTLSPWLPHAPSLALRHQQTRTKSRQAILCSR